MAGGRIGVEGRVDVEALDWRPRVAETYSTSRVVLGETIAWAVSVVRPWLR